MNRRSVVASALVGAIGLGALVARAEQPATAPSQQELLETVRALQAKVEKLEAQQAAQDQEQRTKLRAVDVDKAVADVIKDADRRSKFMAVQSGGFVGYDEDRQGFYIESADRRFVVHPYVLMQVRGVVNSYSPAGGDRDTDGGFEIARARLGFDGKAFLEGLNYRLQWESAFGGAMALQDAFLVFHVNEEWALQVGQFKNDLGHEYMVDESAQLLVDRSLMDAMIGGSSIGRTQGVRVLYTDEGGKWRGMASLNDGALTANTSFADQAGPLNADFGIGGRVEYIVAGNWLDYDSLTGHDIHENILVIGGGGFWSQSGGSDIRTLLVDMLWQRLNGWSVFVSGVVSPSSIDGESATNYGISGQVGYMLDRKWQAFGRAGVTKLDDNAAPVIAPNTGGEDVFPELAVGVNYFFGPEGSYGDRFKLTMDVTLLPNGAPQITPLDFLASDGFEVVFRAQLTFKI